MSHSDAAAHVHHTIDYIEITVTDVPEAKRFYRAAFGWAFNDYGPDYAGIQGQGREVGGLRQDAHVRAGGPLVVLYSRRLDDTMTKVKKAGGRIVKVPRTAASRTLSMKLSSSAAWPMSSRKKSGP